ncbi:thiol-disulfide oxidoreductase DCC family protein [Vibrio hangzhouensis]|uniref:thiol-disulfide oxidoreductase DCC family protein n=1 Tax=Vibrio hangzhouensis TaxID=462991 RepID=UPI001C979F48|nr:DUF393 domain-containing protein [Vibrio hangzhouensis]MBY6195787.1 DUF393 domain-containing protein [Vibrio hangzhouensis]
MPTKLTLFFDATCPLCVREMRALKRQDHSNAIVLVDIFSDRFDDFPEIDVASASEQLHAYDDKGQLYTGLDVTYRAWRIVGKGYLYGFTRWPLLRPFCDWLYLRFAKHRYRISGWLTGRRRCDQCRID